MTGSHPSRIGPLGRQITRFGAVGLLNTMIGVAIIFLLHKGLGAGLILSNAVGYGCGLVVSYVLNGAWTFGYSPLSGASALRFGTLVIVAFTANLGVIYILLAAAAPYMVAQFSGVFTYSATVFVGMRYGVFRHSTLT